MKKHYFTRLVFLSLLGFYVSIAFGQATFNFTGSEQSYTVPAGITSLLLEVSGGQGGVGNGGSGGLGADMSGEFHVTPGEVLTVVVGGAGSQNYNNGSGGAGSGVIQADGTPLIIAGGGGGAAVNQAGLGGLITTTGGSSSGAGGSDGNGGQKGYNNGDCGWAGGGGGYIGDGYGGNGTWDGGVLPGTPGGVGAGKSWANGGAGGLGSGCQFGVDIAAPWGCGGGGTGEFGGGGGGGYSGGGGGHYVDASGNRGGAGGGSYNIGALQANTAANHSGDGVITITPLVCDAITVVGDPGAPVCPGTEITLTASSSNGGTISWDNGIQNGVAFTIESTTTFSAVSDNPVDCSHNITIFVLNDSELPVPDAATLADITDECSVEMPIVPTATDNCAGTIAGTTSTTFPITDQGTTTIIWTYDDGNGNIVTQEQDVIISDVTDPVPDVADLPTIYNQCTVTLTAPTATDNCAGTITATTADPTSYDVQGDYTVTWVYDDGNGNVVTQDQDVSLHDVFDPVPDVEELPALTGQCTVNIAVSPIAWDNCDGHITGTTSVWSFSGEGTYTAVWTYTDAVGNSSTQNQTIVIDDVTAPYPIVSDLPALLGECSVEAPTAPTALDNCEGEITGTSDTEFPVTESTTITWSYDDGNGNVSTQTQVVIISDDTDPVPDAATLTDAEGVCTVTVIAPTATDNCSGAITATTEDPTTYDVAGSYVVTWTYDDGNGNTVSQTQNVIVTDDTAPVPDAVSLTDLMDECSVDAPAAPTATDACAGVVTGTADVEFPITAQGTTTVTWTFDDGNGNTSTQTQDVILADITAPTGTCVDDVVSCDGTVASIALSDVSDNCGTPTVSYELSGATTASGTGDASGEVFEPGTTTVSYVVTDGVGNTNVCYFDVVYTPIGDIELAEADGIITVSAEGTYQWINCADNSEIAGETGSTFEPAETGEYAVVVSSEFCSDTSACVEVVVIDGLKQNDFSKFEFYPNPVTNRLTIELGAEYTNIKLAVVSTSGQLVMDEEMQSGHDAILDMSALTEGVYVIMISCDQGTSQAFVVKE